MHNDGAGCFNDSESHHQKHWQNVSEFHGRHTGGACLEEIEAEGETLTKRTDHLC